MRSFNTVLVAGLTLLLGCKPAQDVVHNDNPVPNQVVQSMPEQRLPPPPFEPEEVRQWRTGGISPQSGRDGFRSSEEWRRWARAEWPKTCRSLQTRTVRGRVAGEGRECRVTAIAGLVPTEFVEARGTLVAQSGEHMMVGWAWTNMMSPSDEEACSHDPMTNEVRNFSLAKSPASTNWKIWPTRQEGDYPRIQDDPVKDTCDDLEAYLRNR